MSEKQTMQIRCIMCTRDTANFCIKGFASSLLYDTKSNVGLLKKHQYPNFPKITFASPLFICS